MEKYPQTATERFDDANFHIKYWLLFIKKYIKGNILEVGAGCGSFTRNYYHSKLKNLVLTETDNKNISFLKENFKNEEKINVVEKSVREIKGKFDSILYLHVLEHIEDDQKEIEEAADKLEKGGNLIIIVPAHQEIYGNLDKAVGHYRRYEKQFFKKDLQNLTRVNLKFLDGIGYILYYFNKIFFKNETYPSKIKIFLWDKIFTPFTVILDFITNYKFGKCIIAVYKKN